MESNKGRGSLTRRYLAALLAPAVVAGVMQVAWPFFEYNPVSPFLLAVIFCAWYGGLGPGLLSVVISVLLTNFIFIKPYFAFWFPKQPNLVRLLIFAAVGAFISVMNELMHRERRRAEINLESAERAEGSLRDKERFAKRAEEQIKQSERQLAEAQHLAHVGSWNWDLQSNVLSWSDELYRIFGVDPQAHYPAYESFVREFVHAEDRALAEGAVERCLKTREPFSFYNRILRPDGEERVIHARGDIVSDEHGNPIRMFGTAQDVTERQQAEERLRATTEQLRALSASLQSAREEEATRIAREIHDELGATLSSLRWDLEDVVKVISESGDLSQCQELRKKIEDMMTLTDTTINTVRRIASELRPSVLDLGLAEAIEWQARQFQDRTEIIVHGDCRLENVDLSREQSTAVFRIFQEALTNILRHSQATTANIQMKEEDGEFILTISDNGRGITEDEKSGQRALGLLGMQERAHLIRGKIEITGSDGKGTVVTVRIPISA
jgi:PAS domain S-box-containing protein